MLIASLASQLTFRRCLVSCSRNLGNVCRCGWRLLSLSTETKQNCTGMYCRSVANAKCNGLVSSTPEAPLTLQYKRLGACTCLVTLSQLKDISLLRRGRIFSHSNVVIGVSLVMPSSVFPCLIWLRQCPFQNRDKQCDISGTTAILIASHSSS